MPESIHTCAEVVDHAEKQRKHVQASLSGKALERALKKVEAELQRAGDRHDCI